MKGILLALGLLLALGGSAAALDVLEVVYSNATSVQACAAAAVQGNAGVGVSWTGTLPDVQLTAPTITPPSPSCLVLPGP